MKKRAAAAKKREPAEDGSDLGAREGGGWTRVGKRPGPVMWVLGFMRIERVWPVRPDGIRYRAWDVIRIPERMMHPTTFHKTLTAAKAHCESIVGTPVPARVR